MPLCEGCNRHVESTGECPHCGATVGTPATANRRRDVGIGAAVVFFVSLGVLIADTARKPTPSGVGGSA